MFLWKIYIYCLSYVHFATSIDSVLANVSFNAVHEAYKVAKLGKYKQIFDNLLRDIATAKTHARYGRDTDQLCRLEPFVYNVTEQGSWQTSFDMVEPSIFTVNRCVGHCNKENTDYPLVSSPIFQVLFHLNQFPTCRPTSLELQDFVFVDKSSNTPIQIKLPIKIIACGCKYCNI